jgi:hypothetical protein
VNEMRASACLIAASLVRWILHDLYIKARELGNGYCPIVEMPCDLFLPLGEFLASLCGANTV